MLNKCATENCTEQKRIYIIVSSLMFHHSCRCREDNVYLF